MIELPSNSKFLGLVSGANLNWLPVGSVYQLRAVRRPPALSQRELPCRHLVNALPLLSSHKTMRLQNMLDVIPKGVYKRIEQREDLNAAAHSCDRWQMRPC